MKIIAHRGASGYKPENTIAAFQHALEIGADMIELDVFRLKSGELVVIHDSRLERTTNGRGKVERHTLEQVRELDAGGSQQIPLLSDVISLVDRRVPINIELKGRGTVKPLTSLLREYFTAGWRPEDFIVSSFNHTLIRRFMRELPEVPVSALVYRVPFWLRPLCFNKNIRSINFSADHVTTYDITMARRLGKQTFVYTVDTPDIASYMHSLQVDAIFTNYPDIIRNRSIS